MKKKIVLAFQGLGKTYTTENYPELKAVDIDFKDFPHNDGWEEQYVNTLIEKSADFETQIVFGNISKQVISLLLEKRIDFWIITPINDDSDEYISVKERLIGRYVLRKTQKPSNVQWLEKMKHSFDIWTHPDFFIECQNNIKSCNFDLNLSHYFKIDDNGIVHETWI